MRDKFVAFKEKENKPPFEIELLIEDMMDDIKNNLKSHFFKHKINHPILIDIRLDDFTDDLKDYHLLENADEGKNGFYTLAFNKETMLKNYGFLIKNVENEFYVLRNRYRTRDFRFSDYYVYQKQIKSKNMQIRDCFKDILNGSIKIKKTKIN